MGSIVHKSGFTWAGSAQVWMSPDSGTTWLQRSNFNLGIYSIVDLTFYSDSIGVVCTNNGFVYYTSDQGISWTEIHRATLSSAGSAYAAAFLGTPNNILIATRGGATVDVTHDGGATWQVVPMGNLTPCVKPLIGGSALALGGTSSAGLSIYKTNDYGVTWIKQNGRVDYDTYSFTVNPCEPNQLYVVNEERTVPNNNFGEIYVSSDGGNSWTVTNSQSALYFCGSVCLSAQAIFVQTTALGVLRSTDQGLNWKQIGGPSAPFDTKLLCAISPNIIIAGDANGSIWRTISSGGDSLLNIPQYIDLSIAPINLFSTDTLANCDTPVVRPIFFSSKLCSQPEIDTQYITGLDSLDYDVVKPILDSLSIADSVLISFRPRSSGKQTGNYVLVLKDGTKFIVPLSGFGKSITFVEPTSVDIVVDTIGGTAYVPIQVVGLPTVEEVELTLHYDKKMLYSGSYALNGLPIDKAGEQWEGRSKLSIPKTDIQLDTISGFATFTIFPDGDTCFKVTIDSLNIINGLAPCLYSIGTGAAINVCPPVGCGVMIITNYLRYQSFPNLFLYPNPTNHQFNITASKSLGECSIEITDELGRTIKTLSDKIEQGKNTIVIGPVRPGKYHARIISDLGMRIFPVIVTE